MAVPEVNKTMLGELESMGFLTSRATRALYYSGNLSIEDAIIWILEHEGDPDVDQIPKVPFDIKIESGEPSEGETTMKLKELREQVQRKNKEEEKRKAREQEKERIRIRKRIMEAKSIQEENDRKRMMASRKAEKEEEKRAREIIRRQLEQDKAERRRMLGLPPLSSATAKTTTLPKQEPHMLKGSRPARFSIEESMKDCLRSLKKNHKVDDAKAKKAFQTLLIYVGNIARNPDDEKYRKIRLSNPLFQDRIGKFEEGVQFLELCGFEKDDGFLYMKRNMVDIDVLNLAGMALNSAITNPYFGLLSL
ncbi:hypothetical protein HPP92_013164 [Vanilla planifolia]|uniref:UBA domain-containing protein n=1 Tax=Vanilla planifolia TaxID=51239 RepID=A0A835QRS8_VANPL|nr:hypothetical protein HPP92_013164 [Vanilla planifolia]